MKTIKSALLVLGLLSTAFSASAQQTYEWQAKTCGKGTFNLDITPKTYAYGGNTNGVALLGQICTGTLTVIATRSGSDAAMWAIRFATNGKTGTHWYPTLGTPLLPYVCETPTCGLRLVVNNPSLGFFILQAIQDFSAAGEEVDWYGWLDVHCSNGYVQKLSCE